MGRVPPSTFNINMKKMAGFCGKMNWRGQRSPNRRLLSHPQENTYREAAMRGLTPVRHPGTLPPGRSY